MSIKAETIQDLQDLLSKAIERAQGLNLSVIEKENGHYLCEGSTGNFYNVFAGKDENGHCWIACTCKARVACKHAGAVFLFILDKRAKKLQASAKSSPSPENFDPVASRATGKETKTGGFRL